MSSVYQLLSPDVNKNLIRVKQATKIGYILLRTGGVQTCLIPHQSFVEEEYKVMVKLVLPCLQTTATYIK